MLCLYINTYVCAIHLISYIYFHRITNTYRFPNLIFETQNKSKLATATEPLPFAIAGLVISGLLLLCGAVYVIYLKRTSICLFFKPEISAEKALEIDELTGAKGSNKSNKNNKNNKNKKNDLKGIGKMNSILPA